MKYVEDVKARSSFRATWDEVRCCFFFGRGCMVEYLATDFGALGGYVGYLEDEPGYSA